MNVPPQITLVRHGRSSHEMPAERITASQFRDWIAAYNRAGLAPDCSPPPDLVERARGIRCLVCSDFPRAAESAARLAPQIAPRMSPLFREVGRPLPEGNTDRLARLEAWDRLSVRLWRAGRIQTDEPVETAELRVARAATELIRLTADYGQVLCVAHGMINAFVADELRRHSWIGPASVAAGHWSATAYRSS